MGEKKEKQTIVHSTLQALKAIFFFLRRFYSNFGASAASHPDGSCDEKVHNGMV